MNDSERREESANSPAKDAYDAKQAKDVKESVDRQKAADMLPRHEPAEKANKEPQAQGHLGHTHDHLEPQLPFHLDKHEAQGQDNDYYNGTSQ